MVKCKKTTTFYLFNLDFIFHKPLDSTVLLLPIGFGSTRIIQKSVFSPRSYLLVLEEENSCLPQILSSLSCSSVLDQSLCELPLVYVGEFPDQSLTCWTLNRVKKRIKPEKQHPTHLPKTKTRPQQVYISVYKEALSSIHLKYLFPH